LNIVYQSGKDTFDRPVVVIIASHIPARKVKPELMLLYLIHVMDKVVEQEYTLVYCHTQMSAANRPAFSWLRKAYSLFNRKYKKNLKALYIIHPGFWVRATFKFFKPFISGKFWKKLVYISQVTDIYNYIKPDQLTLPEHVLSYKQKEGKAASPIFGVPLADAIQRSKTESGLPIVIEHSLAVLVTAAPTVEGIFRISGSKAEIIELKMAYDRGEDVDLKIIEDYHVVAGLLKLFLRELPEPVFPCDTYFAFVSITKQRCEFVNAKESLKENLNKLPKENYVLLDKLFYVLCLISKESNKTKMNASNLAIVFGPNLLRAPQNSEERLIMDTGAINRMLGFLIDYHDELFEQQK